MRCRIMIQIDSRKLSTSQIRGICRMLLSSFYSYDSKVSLSSLFPLLYAIKYLLYHDNYADN